MSPSYFRPRYYYRGFLLYLHYPINPCKYVTGNKDGIKNGRIKFLICKNSFKGLS